MAQINGTQGYESGIESFVTSTEKVSFELLHRDFLPFFPEGSSVIIDIGAGIGRDAKVMAEKGHEVIAVEPLKSFREKGKELYPSKKIKWLDDFLPEIEKLKDYKGRANFVLCSGVWHHLNKKEQEKSVVRITHLLKNNGIFALSLRNGLSGMGINIFPTDCEEIVNHAERNGLTVLLRKENQASLLPGKEKVKWSRLVLQKK